MSIKNRGLWIIGDVHGEYEKLLALLKKLPKDARICFTGDLVDRGNNSAEVVNLVIKNNYECVLGNHEYMMKKVLNEEIYISRWMSNGGAKTMKSYFKYPDEKLLEHMGYINKLPHFLYYEIEGSKPLVVSHSYMHDIWVNKDYRYDKNILDNMIWKHMFDKENFTPKKEKTNNIFNVFGHSIVKEVIITDNYAMIDTGAVYSIQKGYGKLSAICYPTMEVIQI